MKTARSIEEQEARKAEENSTAEGKTDRVFLTQNSSSVSGRRGRVENLKPWPKGVSGNPGGKPKVDLAAEIARAIFQNDGPAIYAAYSKMLRKGSPYEFSARLRSAPDRFAPVRLVPFRLAPMRSDMLRFDPTISSGSLRVGVSFNRSAGLRLAPRRAWERSALERLAPISDAPRRSAPRRSERSRYVADKSAWARFARYRFAWLRCAPNSRAWLRFASLKMAHWRSARWRTDARRSAPWNCPPEDMPVQGSKT